MEFFYTREKGMSHRPSSTTEPGRLAGCLGIGEREEVASESRGHRHQEIGGGRPPARRSVRLRRIMVDGRRQQLDWNPSGVGGGPHERTSAAAGAGKKRAL